MHFSKGLAKKVLRKPPKSCAGVLLSRETLTAMSVGGESGCRKTLIQAHSVAALELKRPPIPGPGASGSRAERREPTAVASSVSWRPAHPWFCFPQSSSPSLSFSPTSSSNRTPKQSVGIHRQVCADRRISCSQGREHKTCVSGSLKLCLHCQHRYPFHELESTDFAHFGFRFSCSVLSTKHHI